MALESVTPRQRERIARAATLFVSARTDVARKGMRFDIITVAPYPRHFRDAWRP
jgi:putative endonuclease